MNTVVKTNKGAVVGSMAAVAAAGGVSLAESFLSASAIVLVDTSGSMAATDSRGGASRYDVACQELGILQNDIPGKIAVISFSDSAQFCPTGIPTFLQGGTDLAGALQFATVADSIPGMKFIVISDGEPHDEQGALAVARQYANVIDAIYVGPEADRGGAEFLRKLAAASGGQFVEDNRGLQLGATSAKLLA